MNHLIPVSIKPHLRRSRSHTTPSPGRPQSFSAEPSPALPVPQSGKGSADTTLTPASSNQQLQSSSNDQSSPRQSADSQRHSRLPHLRLHTHHANGSQAHRGEEHKKKDSNENASDKNVEESKSTSETSTTNPISTSSSRDTARKLDPSPLANVRRHLPDPWTVISPPNDDSRQLLRRSHSHRSNSHNLGGTKDDLLSPPMLGPVRTPGLLASPTSPTRPRATSDSTRPSLSRDVSNVSIGPTTPSDAIALALERGDRRRQIKLLTATPTYVSKLDRAAQLAEEELRRRLNQVEKEGLEITRRLDYTYYSLLERVGDLNAVVSQLQGLRNQALDLGRKLEDDMEGLDEEIGHNIKSLKDNAEGRRMERVEKLEARMKAGKDKARALSDRLELARGRLREWEQWDEARRARIGRRIRMTWIMALLVICLLLALSGMHNLQEMKDTLDDMGLGTHLGPEARKHRNMNDSWVRMVQQVRAQGNSQLAQRLSSVYIPPDVIGLLQHSSIEHRTDTARMEQTPTVSLSKSSTTDDAYLMRIFDEL